MMMQTLLKASGGKGWRCQRIVDNVVPRLDIYVKDDTKCAMFIVIYDETEKMIGQLAMSVYNIEEKLEV